VEPEDFQGTVARFYPDAEPWWPEEVRAPAGSPNVLLIVLDDVGFAQLGCFGSDLDTPTFDRLAAGGLRYANFHTTALCSPTRACLLTGRNHHSVGMGRIVELATGFPGYDARIPRSCGFLPEALVPAGYAAWAVGKWHLTPEDELHEGASRARWPLARGFERFYGFFEGETHQFGPALACDNHIVEQPYTYEEGYHLTEDLVDRAIRMVDDLRAVDPDKPFFCWFCTGACHSPHHSPEAWRERYRGRFEQGWDRWREETLVRQKAMGLVPEHTRLSERPPWVPAWDELSDGERQLYARYMEAFAAYLSHTDHEVGRLLDHLSEVGDLDDTLVVVVSDNGASSEGGPVGSINDVRAWNGVERTVEEALDRLDEIGGPTLHNNYPWGWTVAGNTPFRRWKREVHEGGVADPMIVHWTNGIGARGEIRHQFVHAIDVAPTVLDAVGVDAPATLGGVEQRPLEGASFAASFADPEAPDPRRTQYFEMFGCRAIRHEKWKAVLFHPIQADEPPLSDDGWELYDLHADPSETDDLAATHPDVLADLVARWWDEAARHHVLPVDNRPLSDLVLSRPPGVPPRDRYVYRPRTAMVHEAVAVNVKNRDHRIVADVEVGEEGAEGVLLAQGSVLGGWSFHLVDQRLVYVHNNSGRYFARIEGPARLGPGPHELEFRFTRTGDHRGMGEVRVDGAVVGEGEIRGFTMNRFSITGHGLTCGRAEGIPPCDDYRAPFTFSARLHQVVVEVDGAPWSDPELEAEDAIRRQ
jgi:arylsulfatase A-like enzyme